MTASMTASTSSVSQAGERQRAHPIPKMIEQPAERVYAS